MNGSQENENSELMLLLVSKEDKMGEPFSDQNREIEVTVTRNSIFHSYQSHREGLREPVECYDGHFIKQAAT